MTDAFEAAAPRGNRVFCTVDTWENHIVGTRPSMASRQHDVMRTIENPFLIALDSDQSDREVFYRLSDRQARYMKVVVEILPRRMRRVVTAFPVDSGKAGEKVIWPQSRD